MFSSFGLFQHLWVYLRIPKPELLRAVRNFWGTFESTPLEGPLKTQVQPILQYTILCHREEEIWPFFVPRFHLVDLAFFPNNPRLEIQNWNLFTNGPKRAHNLMPSFMKGLRSKQIVDLLRCRLSLRVRALGKTRLTSFPHLNRCKFTKHKNDHWSSAVGLSVSKYTKPWHTAHRLLPCIIRELRIPDAQGIKVPKLSNNVGKILPYWWFDCFDSMMSQNTG